jgi:hypothetical protein
MNAWIIIIIIIITIIIIAMKQYIVTSFEYLFFCPSM